MEVRINRREVGTYLGDQPTPETQQRQHQIDAAKTSAGASETATVCENLDGPLGAQPENQVHDVNATTEHDRVIRNPAAPPFGQFRQPPVHVVAFDAEQGSQSAGSDCVLEPPKPRRS